MPYAYSELLEPCPPMYASTRGHFRSLDAHHLFVVSTRDYSTSNPGNIDRGVYAIMDTSTGDATAFTPPWNYRPGEYGCAVYDGRAWVSSTSGDYETIQVSVHAVEADGGVYSFNTGYWLYFGAPRLGARGAGDLYLCTFQLNSRTVAYSMATSTLGQVVFNRTDLPINTGTGTPISFDTWAGMTFRKVGSVLYGTWFYGYSNVWYLYSVDLSAWTVTELASGSAAIAAVTAEPMVYTLGKYWSHGNWWDLNTMTGGSVTGESGLGQTLGPDGLIYWIGSTSALTAMDPRNGATKSEAIPNRGDRFGVIWQDGALWAPSGQPYT